MKTGFFKWKPDISSAAFHIAEAAKKYKGGGCPKLAIDAYLIQAELNEKLNEYIIK